MPNEEQQQMDQGLMHIATKAILKGRSLMAD
jgi:hypothetical protein